MEKDCNAVAADIAAKIDPKSLCPAFLDPTGLHVKFSTIETLTKGKQVDLIIHFSHGESIKRNIAGASATFKSQMDEFFGGDEWRAIYEKNRANPINLTNDLLVLYQAKLAKIGYKMEPDDAVLVKNTKNVPMYSLIFASKHPRGMNFWKKAKQIESKGQRGLPFDLE